MLEKMRKKDFAQVFSLMEASFPLDEYRPFQEQEALLNNPLYVIYVVPEKRSGRILAFLALWKFPDFSYIEHFAVRPDCRSRGLGAKILKELSEKLNARICLEAEPADHDLAKRRIDFYVRNGYYVNDYPYMQPPISKGRQPVLLKILTFGERISPGEFQKIKAVLYEYVYQAG